MTKDCTVTLLLYQRCLLLNDGVNTGATQKAVSYASANGGDKYIALWRHVVLLWEQSMILFIVALCCAIRNEFSL